ncbi:zinc finger MYM-type protein 2-like [Saccostrea cucullata]|uniref:zinc finger MYM-type protein 2-like n=1 Tax=Saccostrea cuccullata TaxID=36930 RepID=UPI002ED18E93
MAKTNPNDKNLTTLDIKGMEENENDTDNDLNAFIEDLDEETLAGISYNIIGDFSVELTPGGDQVSQNKRFAEVCYDDIDKFLTTNENKNTSKKTKCDINTFKEFLQAKGEFRVPEIIPPFELNLHIASFLLSVKKKDGTEYEPTSLRAYMSSINRYLQQKEYGYSIINDLQFSKARDVLKTKQKQLKSLGKGNKPMAADELTENEFKIFYEKKILGPYTPTSLTNSMFTICTNHFGMRPGREVHDLTWGDIELKYDEGENLEYIVFNQERQTKTRTGANPRDVRKLKPRAYATPAEPEKDPVSLYKKFSDMRPEETKQENSPFFLAVNARADLGKILELTI